ncbi:hypothetical protein K461DRAFT_316010 [Myriangium duriaei CBS 260.36]|uniref:Uncharacterized protein n=1 Tax=Myriangium duriaei CBS 260.36 TaxID=1168546 RepID=A0A9P4MCT3_9PEZI|nr:hypothetical protein K461DRAFT_316010 [Myriangium duriaei CBS 260.36]
MVAPNNRVELIPWDPENDKQFQRVKDQQSGLGWFKPTAPLWKDEQLQGVRTVFWIAIADTEVNQKSLVDKHVAKFPAEREPISDTATTIGGAPRNPTYKAFTPVGHVALRASPPSDSTKLGLPPSSLRLVSFYVSWALQGTGIGAGAISQLDRVAASVPFNAAAISLECITKEFQMQEVYLEIIYDKNGQPRPTQSNVEWYSKRGFTVIDGSEFQVPSESPVIAEMLPIVSLVHMQKRLR